MGGRPVKLRHAQAARAALLSRHGAATAYPRCARRAALAQGAPGRGAPFTRHGDFRAPGQAWQGGFRVDGRSLPAPARGDRGGCRPAARGRGARDRVRRGPQCRRLPPVVRPHRFTTVFALARRRACAAPAQRPRRARHPHRSLPAHRRLPPDRDPRAAPAALRFAERGGHPRAHGGPRLCRRPHERPATVQGVEGGPRAGTWCRALPAARGHGASPSPPGVGAPRVT